MQWEALKVIKRILKWNLKWTGSQCKWGRVGVTCSHLLFLVWSLAAAFWTNWSLEIYSLMWTWKYTVAVIYVRRYKHMDNLLYNIIGRCWANLYNVSRLKESWLNQFLNMKIRVKILIKYNPKISSWRPYIFCQGPKVQSNTTGYVFWADY